ncbi:alpha/beta hydrolase [Haloferula sp. A504]|uniref:alpha/beta hydrolase n=1 Tax=Haloferula sp. A504 TaxID=3373601 RepID=UPI0031BC4083|nr:alpha/beta hydrolase [Verrucomicrobiaceae bacterium E54]
MRSFLSAVALALVLTSCGSGPKPQWLMPTPVMYLDGKVDPFGHLPAAEKRTDVEVFYSTNRRPSGDHYGNGVDATLRFGKASVEIGEETDTWEVLAEVSTIHPRPRPMPLRLAGFDEFGTDEDPAVMKRWAAAVDRAVRRTSTRDVVIYVHGAKVDFLHSCAFAAELGHFAGRDFTPVAFDWPTHQEILSYLDGVDVDHARRSADRLAETIRLLADGTCAQRIHIISWSAGARVHSRALAALGQGDLGAARKRYRLGVMAFAAGDVPVKDFLDRLPAIHGLSDDVLVYMSDADGALKWSARLMGDGRRLGFAPRHLNDEERAVLRSMPRLEAIDTSLGQQQRGFDITGHRYWFKHPWVNSDLILALRTGAPAAKRGLSESPIHGVWEFSGDYPGRVGSAARRLTGGSW